MTDFGGDRGGRPDSDTVAFSVPSLRARHVYLRPVGPEDYLNLRNIDLSGEMAVRWRFRGATPSPDQWVQASSGAAVLAQFLVVRASDTMPVGMVVAYEANFQDGHAYFAASSFESASPSPLMMFGTALFLRYVFHCWGFHKLYVELPEYNAAQIGSGLGRLFELEARLVGHMFYGGRRWDRLTYALYRETWDRESERTLEAAGVSEGRVMRVRFPSRET